TIVLFSHSLHDALPILFGLSEDDNLGTLDRVKRLKDFITKCSDSGIVDDDDLPEQRKYLRVIAHEQLLFSVQHFAFLLDTLSFQDRKSTRLNSSHVKIS